MAYGYRRRYARSYRYGRRHARAGVRRARYAKTTRIPVRRINASLIRQVWQHYPRLRFGRFANSFVVRRQAAGRTRHHRTNRHPRPRHPTADTSDTTGFWQSVGRGLLLASAFSASLSGGDRPFK